MKSLAEYDQHMPQNICTLCCKELRKSYTFMRQAQFSNKILMCSIEKQLSNASENPVIASQNSNIIKKNDIRGQHKTMKNDLDTESTNNVLLGAVKLENETKHNETLQENAYGKVFSESGQNNFLDVEKNPGAASLISEIKTECQNEDIEAVEPHQNKDDIINSLDNKSETKRNNLDPKHTVTIQLNKDNLMEHSKTVQKHHFKDAAETEISNKHENLPHLNYFQIKSEGNIEHIKVVEISKTENDLKNSPFISLETNWANERIVSRLDELEDNTDSDHSQVTGVNNSLIISEIKIEESKIEDDVECKDTDENKDTDDEWLRCYLCPRKYKARSNYVYHLKHKHGITKEKQKIEYTANNKRKDKAVKCRSCDYVAKNHCRLYYHTRTRHTTEEDKFKCQFCSYKHIMKRKLFNHTKRAHKDLIKALKSKAKNNSELSTSNKSAPIEDISEGKYSSGESNSLEQEVKKKTALHLKTQTEETEQSSDEEFIKKMLNIKKINYPKRYDPKSWARHCEECGKFCKDYDSFYAHKQIHRSEDEKIPCPHCDKKVNRKSELRGHIKRVHEKREKQFVCSSCNFATALKSELNLHFREQHSGERPFKCDICSQSYRSKNVLQEHIRRHNKEKQSCKDCGKLIKHLNAHKRYCWAKD